MKLEAAIKMLYDAGISCGVQTVPEIGMRVWLGDPVGGIIDECWFSVDEGAEAAAWLAAVSEEAQGEGEEDAIDLQNKTQEESE